MLRDRSVISQAKTARTLRVYPTQIVSCEENMNRHLDYHGPDKGNTNERVWSYKNVACTYMIIEYYVD